MSTVVQPGPIAITEADFERFRVFFYRRTGIHFDDTKRYFVDKRLQERIAEQGCQSFTEYYNRMRCDSDRELQALVNLMTVNETYFFRESYQLDCLVHNLLNEVVARKRPGERIRIWSMPCSSGEEPYSIAMAILEGWPPLERWDIEILASDIDTAVLDRARQAIYDKRAVHNLPPVLLGRYFDRRQSTFETRYQLKPEVREAVGFRRVNLHSATEVQAMGPMDVVFCRNLLIYFDELSRRQAVERLYSIVNPGGFVCLGHSESMSRISTLFRARKFPDALVYQKQPPE